MKIGSLLVEPPLVLAPMSGITSWPLRMLCRRLGASLAFTEMVPAAAIVRGKSGRDVLNSLKTHPHDRPLGIQLYGSDPEEMAEAAGSLSALMADLIDLNMGCPVKKVVKAGAGCALMGDLDRARRMIQGVRAAVKVPLTVKMRLGLDRESRSARDLAQICEAEGVDAVVVHGRTRAQGFAGDPDLAGIREVVEAVTIPVIGNGGITCPADAENMTAATGCAGVMVARGARGNPWIFAALKHGPDSAPANPSLGEKARVILQHLEWMRGLFPEKKAVLEMRKHLAWYSKGIPGAGELRKKLSGLENAGQVEALVGKYFLEPSGE